jgi:alpha-ribazole phosphatase
MILYLIRHTTPDIAPATCYGQTDVGVLPSFVEEAASVKERIDGLEFAARWASPLGRCQKLATHLFGDEFQTDHRLKELHFGEWEGRAWNDLHQPTIDHWMDHFADQAPPGGETFGELHQRAHDFVAELSAQHQGQPLALVTHAGVIRVLLAEALKMPLKEVFRFHLDFGGITRIRYDGKLERVDFINR